MAKAKAKSRKRARTSAATPKNDPLIGPARRASQVAAKAAEDAADGRPNVPGAFHVCQHFNPAQDAAHVARALELLTFSDPNIKALRDVLHSLLAPHKCKDAAHNYAPVTVASEDA